MYLCALKLFIMQAKRYYRTRAPYTQYKEFFISSNERTNGHVTDFNYLLYEQLYPVRLSLKSVHIPNTFYRVRTGVNDTLRVEIYHNVNDTTDVADFVIPEGTYTSSQLISEINSIFAADSAPFTNLTMAEDETKRKFTITSSDSAEDVSIVKQTNDCGDILGHGDEDANGGNTLIMPNVYRMNESVLYVQSRTFNNVLKKDAIMKPSSQITIAQVPVNANFGSTITYENQYTRGTLFDCKDKMLIQELNFQLVHEDGTNVDLNGADWSIRIGLETFEDNENLLLPDVNQYQARDQEMIPIDNY